MLTNDEAKKLIVEIVESVQGCKATELAANSKIAIEVGSNLVDLIEELIQEGELAGIEYIVPNLPDRRKLYLFPKGTKAKIK